MTPPMNEDIKRLVEALEDSQSTLQAVRDIPPNDATRMMVDWSLKLITQALASLTTKETEHG